MLVFVTLNTFMIGFFSRTLLSGVKPQDLFQDLSEALFSLTGISTKVTASRFFYASVGNVFMYVFAVEMLLPDLFGEIFTKILKRRRIKKHEKEERTTDFFKQIFMGFVVDFPTKYAKVGYLFIFGIGFGSGIPALTVFATVSLAGLYFMTRNLFITTSKVPFRLDRTTIYSTIRAGYFAVLWRLLFSLFALSDPTVFPVTSQKNLVGLSVQSILKGLSSSAGMLALGSRLDSLPIHFFLLVLWVLFLLTHLIVTAILDWKRSSNWLAAEIELAEAHIEEDEVTNNILDHRPRIESYTLFSYSMFRNPEYQILKTFLSNELPNEEPKKVIVDIDKSKKPALQDPNSKPDGTSAAKQPPTAQNITSIKNNKVAPLPGGPQGTQPPVKKVEFDPTNLTQMQEGKPAGKQGVPPITYKNNPNFLASQLPGPALAQTKKLTAVPKNQPQPNPNANQLAGKNPQPAQPSAGQNQPLQASGQQQDQARPQGSNQHAPQAPQNRPPLLNPYPPYNPNNPYQPYNPNTHPNQRQFNPNWNGPQQPNNQQMQYPPQNYNNMGPNGPNNFGPNPNNMGPNGPNNMGPNPNNFGGQRNQFNMPNAMPGTGARPNGLGNNMPGNFNNPAGQNNFNNPRGQNAFNRNGQENFNFPGAGNPQGDRPNFSNPTNPPGNPSRNQLAPLNSDRVPLNNGRQPPQTSGQNQAPQADYSFRGKNEDGFDGSLS